MVKLGILSHLEPSCLPFLSNSAGTLNNHIKRKRGQSRQKGENNKKNKHHIHAFKDPRPKKEIQIKRLRNASVGQCLQIQLPVKG